MSDIRYHILEMWHVWWDFFRRDARNHWRNIFLLVLADAITRILGLDASCGLNPLLLFPLFLYSLGLLAGVIGDTCFELTEKLTGDAQNKSNPPSEPGSLSKHNAPSRSKTRTNRQRQPQHNRKYKRICPSQGNSLAKGTRSSKGKHSSKGNPLWRNQLKQGGRATLVLLLVITVCSILIPSTRNGTNQRLWILLLGHLLAPFFNFISYLYFEPMEDVTSNYPSKDNPPNGGQRPPGQPPKSNPAKLKRKAKRKPPSPGNRTLKANHSTKGNRQFEPNSHSNGNNATTGNVPPQSNAPTNYLARFAPEIRLQIFKHYFTAFRPERIYRESHYKGHYFKNLLNALHDGSNQRQYEEALEQYQKASHLSLLLHGADVGKDFVDNLEPSALSSLKEITFGPSVIERLILPDNPSPEFGLTNALRLFGWKSKLAQANDLHTLTLYLGETAAIVARMSCLFLFSTITMTFQKLGKMRFCFPSKSTSKERAEKAILMLHQDLCMGMNIPVHRIPQSSEIFGCQHDNYGFIWHCRSGRNIEIEFTIYDG